MSSATLHTSRQFHAQREPGTTKAFVLSLGAHLFLIALLTLGIHWKTSSSPAGVEVELWDASVAAGAEGGSGGKVGDGVGAGGNAPPGYADRVRKKIKPLIVFNAESTTGNPAVVVLVDLAPDGMILKRTVTSASTDPAWDRAVLIAIDRAESLPRDENGKIPMRQIKLTFKPKD
ncbi:MAG: cell envelope integrity protein TolA [Burkholderiaceae bacterium]|nr:cell envelope integrity protein TolA [Burkholderiaceae bacterium]